MGVWERPLDARACPLQAATWVFAELLEEGEPKSWANPRISTISVYDGPILRKKLPLTLHLVNFLLDVRRFWQQAVVDEKLGKNAPF